MAHICLLQSIINVAHILMPAGNLSLLQLAVILATENASRGHTRVEKEEAIIKNWQSDRSGSDGLYHIPEDELGHLLEKRGGLKKVQMIVTLTIFLSSKRYGNPRVL
jgi:hypothetical protein